MITKLSNLAMRRQSGVKHGYQYLVETVQCTRMGEKSSKSGGAVLHQRLHAFELAAGFSRRVRHL